MKTIGFPISHKENENRRALVPKDIAHIANPEQLYFEKGYGEVIGYSDEDYLAQGAHLVSREETLKKDVVCDPKIGDADYLSELDGQVIFGWIHAVQNKDITDKIIAGNLTAYAWEDMFDQGRHVFFRSNELAGEAAVMHAFQCYGEMPYNTKVALLGRGNVANGALRILTMLGADVTQYGRRTEKLFIEELPQFDVVVNAILWDTSRTDHIVYASDLSRMKKGSLIIDISCDRCGGIESSIPTTIESPTYYRDGIMHYVVDHTPSLFAKTSTKSISIACAKYINDLILEKENEVLDKAKAIEKGIIIDKRIDEFQKR